MLETPKTLNTNLFYYLIYNSLYYLYVESKKIKGVFCNKLDSENFRDIFLFVRQQVIMDNQQETKCLKFKQSRFLRDYTRSLKIFSI